MKSRIKRGASLHKLLEWIYISRVLKAIVVILDRPMISSEIKRTVMKRLNLEQLKISDYIKKLEDVDILKCLTPELRKGAMGRVHGLSKKGMKLKKRLCEKDNIELTYRQLSDVDWYSYGRVVCGSQKLTVIRAIPYEGARVRDIVKRTKEFYSNREGKEGIKKENICDILKRMLKEKLVTKTYREEKESGRKKRTVTVYKLTDRGELIKKQIGEFPAFE